MCVCLISDTTRRRSLTLVFRHSCSWSSLDIDWNIDFQVHWTIDRDERRLQGSYLIKPARSAPDNSHVTISLQ